MEASRQLPQNILMLRYSTDVGLSKMHPTMTCAGGECGIPFYKRYQMPSEFLKLWYSFDVGPIHNLVFSTELDYSRGSEQFNFILSVSQPSHPAVKPAHWLCCRSTYQ